MPDRLVLAGAVVAEMAAAWVMVGGPPPEEIIVYLPAHGTRRGRLPIRVQLDGGPRGRHRATRTRAADRSGPDRGRRGPAVAARGRRAPAGPAEGRRRCAAGRGARLPGTDVPLPGGPAWA